jgi:hypothetical protein
LFITPVGINSQYGSAFTEAHIGSVLLHEDGGIVAGVGVDQPFLFRVVQAVEERDGLICNSLNLPKPNLTA